MVMMMMVMVMVMGMMMMVMMMMLMPIDFHIPGVCRRNRQPLSLRALL
jgi:hypothetical protein